MLATSILRTVAYLLLYLSLNLEDKNVGFYINLIGSALYGCCMSVDQNIFIGFLKRFPPYCYSTFSSADGLSGLFTVLFYLLCKYFGVSLSLVFLIYVPSNIAVVILFYKMVQIRDEVDRQILEDEQGEGLELKMLENELLPPNNQDEVSRAAEQPPSS